MSAKIGFAVVVILGVVVWLYFGNSNTTGTAGTDAEAMSDVSYADLSAVDVNGETHQLGEWIGKQPVVINFWGTWCPPCRHEIPDLIRAYEEYHDQGVEVLGFAVRDRPDEVREYTAAHDMNWVHFLGDEDLANSFGGLRGVPTTIFLNASGEEVGRYVGARGYNDFKQAFESIL